MATIATGALEVGDSAPAREFGPITRTAIVRYAGASGDFNPLHHDDEFAAVAGFPAVFSIGMLQGGYLATFVTDWLGVDGLRRYAMRFREQVWLGDVLTCTGTIAAVEIDDSGEETIEVELACDRQTGAPAVTATATYVRPADSGRS